jgi:hypothetical protein
MACYSRTDFHVNNQCYDLILLQVRAEQLTSERTTTLNRRLGEELEVMRNEAIRSKKNEEQLAAMHEKQVAALNALLSQQENVRGEVGFCFSVFIFASAFIYMSAL